MDFLSSINFNFDNNLLLSLKNNNYEFKYFSKKGSLKFDKGISDVAAVREDQLYVVQAKLSEMRDSLIKNVKSKKKSVIKSRMKKLLKLSSELEDDLLYYRISVETHIW